MRRVLLAICRNKMLFYRVMNKAPCERTQQCCQQLPTLLDVTPCVLLHILLRVVGSCCAKFETGQTFSYVQTDATTLIIIVGHQCCTCTLLNTCIALYNLTQHCWPTISQHCWMLQVASVCTSYCMLLRNVWFRSNVYLRAKRTQQLPTWLGQQCWELPNIYQPKLIIGITP